MTEANGGDGAPGPGQEAVFRVISDVIGGVCDVDDVELTPDRRIGDLGIDSLLAGEVVSQAEMALNIDVDFRRISDNWSGLTLGELADQIWSGSRSRP